ncbi:hypothetical protein FB45DRAFT_1143857 [Roridomyces roridus]|uniref:Uncharacterized protein n=1 Tax=Roridomyces roridus TaxID=1738132 RepID=A0AAD7F933_9AGAR|nr:hypothetical protein FB45DRAFT_1143857 [Roridomyces roridus]
MSRSKENSQHSKHHKHHKDHSHHRHESRTPLAAANTSTNTDDRLRELKDALRHEKKKRHKAEKRARKAQLAASTAADANAGPSSVADGSIERPRCASKVTMRTIRSHLGYDKPKWNAFRLCIQRTLHAARLDWSSDWRSQDPESLRAVWNVVLEKFPEAKRFRRSWGVERVAKQCWDGANSYERDMNNPNSYRSLHSTKRSSQQVPDRSPSPTPSTSTSTRTPASSRPHPLRVNSSDVESGAEDPAVGGTGDGDVVMSDGHGDGGGDGGDEDD